MFSDYGCSEDESRKKRSVEDDLGTKMPFYLYEFINQKKVFAIFFISRKRQKAKYILQYDRQ